MFSNFSEFWVCIKEARFTFEIIWREIVSLYFAITENPTVSAVWNGIMDAIAPIYVIAMSLVVLFCLVVAFFGKKMLAVLKFGCFFVAGFALGAHLLAPLIPADVNIPAWLVGIVVALVAGVLYRFIYIVLYVTIAGYGMYILSFYTFYLNVNATYSTGRAIACIIAGAAAIAVSIIFRKYFEMVGTAVLGAWCATWVFANYVYNFTAISIFEGIEWLAMVIPVVIISVLGSIVQIKTRKRY